MTNQGNRGGGLDGSTCLVIIHNSMGFRSKKIEFGNDERAFIRGE